MRLFKATANAAKKQPLQNIFGWTFPVPCPMCHPGALSSATSSIRPSTSRGPASVSTLLSRQRPQLGPQVIAEGPCGNQECERMCSGHPPIPAFFLW